MVDWTMLEQPEMSAVPFKGKIVHLMSPSQKSARKIARIYRGKRIVTVTKANVRIALESTKGPKQRKVIEAAAHPILWVKTFA
ncbi:hypothetical protein DPMN_162182 [Dreissena polymorpha]|uniref:Uncharacterized protein n=1 Tax=Dreissena polymorpha TaxID=45954 RepID=A0A9D4ER79_DREPO|nr:hypothetical protein DPMN_162182 [Dreissena polymorpha]